MKSFIFSIIIFFLLVILIIFNSIYIHKTADKMLMIANSLSLSDAKGTEELYSIWQKNRLFFTVSIHDSEIEKITELTENIKSAATIGDGTEFKKNIVLLSELLDELKRNEEISLQGII